METNLQFLKLRKHADNSVRQLWEKTRNLRMQEERVREKLVEVMPVHQRTKAKEGRVMALEPAPTSKVSSSLTPFYEIDTSI